VHLHEVLQRYLLLGLTQQMFILAVELAKQN